MRKARLLLTGEIHNSQLLENMGAGVRNLTSTAVDDINTYWGAPTGPSGDGPSNGNEVFGNVAFVPWLNETECDNTHRLYLPLIGN